jgi:hypothetical protein
VTGVRCFVNAIPLRGAALVVNSAWLRHAKAKRTGFFRANVTANPPRPEERRRRRRVSKDDPERANVGAIGTMLRDAMLRTAPQHEGL